MPDQPFVYATGTPSGGTSCLAGVLYHLGVNMGRWQDRDQIRGYVTFEDQDINSFRIEPAGNREPRLLRLRCRLADYLAHRRRLDPHGRLGFKGSAFFPLREPLPGVQVVVIERPLVDSIASDRRIHRQIRIDRERPAMTPIEECERAAIIGAAWAAARQLETVLRIPFYGLLDDTLLMLKEITGTLRLDPSPGMIDAAARFVDSERPTRGGGDG